jgi:hypothetical protein
MKCKVDATHNIPRAISRRCDGAISRYGEFAELIAESGSTCAAHLEWSAGSPIATETGSSRNLKKA